ncbi:hypothetical protein KR018_008018 [Drosophila ironensis]|nr:hypothetical protein KR018_008018 [Drosophila ironensis]
MAKGLYTLGLAIGWMDIAGVVIFETLMFYLMRHRQMMEEKDVGSIEGSETKISKTRSLASLMTKGKLGAAENSCIFWGYLMMLNIWVMITLLMMAGISMQKPELMTMWLIWCAGGLVFDALFIFWWIYKICADDAIEALTNIIISLLTMGQ